MKTYTLEQYTFVEEIANGTVTDGSYYGRTGQEMTNLAKEHIADCEIVPKETIDEMRTRIMRGE